MNVPAELYNGIEGILQKCITCADASELPLDSITCIKWYANGDPIFGVSSFDGSFRLYKINFNQMKSSFSLIYQYNYNFPILWFDFSSHLNQVFLATCDGKVLFLDPSTQQGNMGNPVVSELQCHDCPVMKVFFVKECQYLISADTNRNIKVFDLKMQNIIFDLPTNKIIQDCDFVYPILAVVLSDNSLDLIDIKDPKK
jgi:WD40 repeat protein